MNHGHTPHGEARPLADCRDCERWLQRTTAGKATGWLEPVPMKLVGLDHVCTHRIPAAD